MTEFDGTCGTCEIRACWMIPGGYQNGCVDGCACAHPTERRAALIAQLSQEDREALELGCRVQEMEIGTSLTLWPSGSWGVEYYDEDADEWKGINQDKDGIVMQDTALEALRGAPSPFIENGEKGEETECQ